MRAVRTPTLHTSFKFLLDNKYVRLLISSRAKNGFSKQFGDDARLFVDVVEMNGGF